MFPFDYRDIDNIRLIDESYLIPKKPFEQVLSATDSVWATAYIPYGFMFEYEVDHLSLEEAILKSLELLPELSGRLFKSRANHTIKSGGGLLFQHLKLACEGPGLSSPRKDWIKNRLIPYSTMYNISSKIPLAVARLTTDTRGFSYFGFTLNHAVSDAYTSLRFLKSLSEIINGKPITITFNRNRDIFTGDKRADDIDIRRPLNHPIFSAECSSKKTLKLIPQVFKIFYTAKSIELKFNIGDLGESPFFTVNAALIYAELKSIGKVNTIVSTADYRRSKNTKASADQAGNWVFSFGFDPGAKYLSSFEEYLEYFRNKYKESLKIANPELGFVYDEACRKKGKHTRGLLNFFYGRHDRSIIFLNSQMPFDMLGLDLGNGPSSLFLFAVQPSYSEIQTQMNSKENIRVSIALPPKNLDAFLNAIPIEYELIDEFWLREYNSY